MRPLAYNLLLETLPSEKRSWRAAAKQDRDRYHVSSDRISGNASAGGLIL